MRRTIVAGVVAIHIVLMLDGIWSNFVTLDEHALIASGLAHWETGKYAAYRVNPPLGRMLATLPLYAGNAGAKEALKGVDQDVPAYRSEWRLGDALVEAKGADFLGLLRVARLAGIAWSLLGAWIIYRWAGELYGPNASCLGLVMWCFGPNVLAHAGLATPDVPAAAAGLTATYSFWRYLRSPSWRAALVTGLLLGICQLTKFTLLVFYPIWPLLWLIYRLRNGSVPASPATPARTQLGQGLTMVIISIFIINLGFEFKDTCWRLADFPFVSHVLAGDPDGVPGYAAGTWGNRFRDSSLGRIIVPVPADFVRGIDVQRRDFEALGRKMPSYLAGEWKDTGWWYYYLYGIAVKVPLGILLLVGWNIALMLLKHPSSARWEDELTLWAPVLVILFLVSSQTGFNHHLRYVLPTFPFVIVSTSKLGYFFHPSRWKYALVVVALLSWAVLSCVLTRPHYLSYFNELAGGPDNGHKHLLNSNIDWGQDLLHLKKWLDKHPEAKPLGLAFCNFTDPRIIGIEFTLPPYGPTGELSPDKEELLRLGPKPGYYAISVNYLYGFPFSTHDGTGNRIWLPRHVYDYFRHFQPIAKAGYSIFIYHITPEQANQVRIQYGLPPIKDVPP